MKMKKNPGRHSTLLHSPEERNDCPQCHIEYPAAGPHFKSGARAEVNVC